MIKEQYIPCVKFDVTYAMRKKYRPQMCNEVFNMRLLDLDYYVNVEGFEIKDFNIYQMKQEYITKCHRKE